MRGTGDARLSAVETDAVLFLDFDGVLHPYGCAADQFFCRLGLLQDWLRHRPGVDVVISSTWREARSVGELASIFACDLRPRVISVTPRFMHESWDQFGGEPPPPRHPRHAEVMAWLRQSAKPWRRWAALDDQSWLYRPFARELIVCDHHVGLTDAELKALDAVLGCK